MIAEEDLRRIVRFDAKLSSHSWNRRPRCKNLVFEKAVEIVESYQSRVCYFVEPSLQWQSEAEQGGSRRDGQECVRD